jgi:hypothetical protein
MMAMLKSDASQAVRLAALEALRLSKGGNPDELMQIALADKSPAVRRAAMAILPTLPLSPAAKTQQLATLYAKGSTAEKQGVLEVLGGLKSPESRLALHHVHHPLLRRWRNPSTLEAVRPTARRRWPRARDVSHREAPTRWCRPSPGAQEGGDFHRGMRVVSDNPPRSARCHTICGRGGDTGRS